MDAIHQREYDSVGSPFHPGRREVSTADLKVVFPGGNAFRLVVTRGWINGEVGITSVGTGLVPLGKLNIDFIFSVGATVMSGPVGEQSEDRRLIHVVDVTLDHPLVSSESHIVGREHLA